MDHKSKSERPKKGPFQQNKKRKSNKFDHEKKFNKKEKSGQRIDAELQQLQALYENVSFCLSDNIVNRTSNMSSTCHRIPKIIL